MLLGSDALGVTARVDVIEADDERVIPVDYKRGAPPDVPEGAYEPERVQVCVQGLLLREHGYECDEGALYFAETNQRVRVELTDELVTRTRELIAKRAASPPTGRSLRRSCGRRSARAARSSASACRMKLICCGKPQPTIC